jgi:hypothetical protein
MSDVYARRWPADVWRLLAVTLGVWLLIAAPAWWLAGANGVEGAAWSALLCTLPGCVTLAAVDRLDDRKRPVFGMLLGTGLRLGMAAPGGFAVAWFRPELRAREFFLWLVLFYLITLAVETRLLLTERGGWCAARSTGT